MCSKYCIKWRHYAISAKSITIYGTNWSCNGNPWIINKIIISDYIISIQIFIIYNFSVKIISLTNYSLFCGIRKWLGKLIIFILFRYLIGNLE